MLLIRLRASGGQPVHARAAGAVLRTASGRFAPGSPARAMALCNLGYALMLGESGPEEITEAVTVLRESFAQTPSGDPNYARCARPDEPCIVGRATARLVVPARPTILAWLQKRLRRSRC